MRYLVTGGCGFIGSNFIYRCLEKNKKIKIINLDAMYTGSNPANFKNFKNPNYSFVKGNICNQKLMEKLVTRSDIIINFAAESHVDRSISDPKTFIRSNIIGVYTILEILRKKKTVKLLQISTDEVYGESMKKNFIEHDELNPSNPYAATKASAEMLIRSYVRTYGINAIITRCTNNFGPRQFPEKLIPKTILSALKHQPIPLHGKGNAKRRWIHVQDHCDALLKIISKWKGGSIYNISGNYEITNLDLVKKILNKIRKNPNLIKFVPDRPGQDRNYKINSNLIKKELGFEPKINPKVGLESTIIWYISNKDWWEKLPFNIVKNPTPWIKK